MDLRAAQKKSMLPCERNSCFWGQWARHLQAHAELYFLLLCMFHFAAWVLIPFFSQGNLHLDVVECLVWGKEWQWGYHKHPPLHAWVTEVFFAPFGTAAWPGFVLSQLCVILTFICVWRLAKLFVGKTMALMAVALLEGIFYCNFLTVEFNSNVSLLPLWAWAVYAFYMALQKGSLWRWLFWGLMFGLCCLSKYNSFMLLGVWGLFLLWTPKGRQVLRKPGIYMGSLISLMVFFPHLQWVLSHDWVTLSYFSERASLEGSHSWPSLIYPLRFLGAQCLAISGALLMFCIAFYNNFTKSRHALLRLKQRPDQEEWEKTFITFSAFGPLVLSLLLSFCFNIRLRAMWGAPFFIFLPLWLVCRFVHYSDEVNITRFLKSFFAVIILTLAAYVAMVLGEPHFLHRPKRIHFPGQVMAQTMTKFWHEYTNQRLCYVIGDIWEAGLVGFYSPDRPSVLINGDYLKSPWIRPSDLKEFGAIIVWVVTNDDESMPRHLYQKFPKSIVQPALRLQYITSASLRPAVVGWAILLPQLTGRDSSKL